MVGYLELLGGLGQIVGYYFYPPLFIAATLGITVLMFMAIGSRTKLRDPIHQVLRAFTVCTQRIFAVRFTRLDLNEAVALDRGLTDIMNWVSYQFLIVTSQYLFVGVTSY